jgi:hypothetical protein
VPEDGGLIGQALIGLKPMNAWVHTYTEPQTSSTRSRGLGRRIHESVEDTKLSTNKQHTLSKNIFLFPVKQKTAQFLPFIFYFISFINPPSPLCDAVGGALITFDCAVGAFYYLGSECDLLPEAVNNI